MSSQENTTSYVVELITPDGVPADVYITHGAIKYIYTAHGYAYRNDTDLSIQTRDDTLPGVVRYRELYTRCRVVQLAYLDRGRHKHYYEELILCRPSYTEALQVAAALHRFYLPCMLRVNKLITQFKVLPLVHEQVETE